MVLCSLFSVRRERAERAVATNAPAPPEDPADLFGKMRLKLRTGFARDCHQFESLETRDYPVSLYPPSILLSEFWPRAVYAAPADP